MADYKPLQEKAYDYLKEQILSGKLEHDTIYSETKLSAEIGISRTPMKAALMRLSQDRFIDIIPSKGFKLHEMSEKDIWTTYQSRTAIEGFCALNLAQNKTTPEGIKTLAKLKKSITNMENAIHEGKSVDTILEYDLLFHKELVGFSDNPELIKLYESYNHRLQTIAIESFELPERPEDALAEHKEVYDAIISTDGETGLEAYQAVQKHMEASRDIALQKPQNNS